MSSTDISESFDYGMSAELFSSKASNGRRQPLSYRRFAQAAEAIRFAIEDLPQQSLVGTYLEVNELRYESAEIRRLYESVRYPLSRRLWINPRRGVGGLTQGQMNDYAPEAELDSAACQSCGACCSFSRRVAAVYIGKRRRSQPDSPGACRRRTGPHAMQRQSVLRPYRDRRVATSCAIYAQRPDVCKACLPGDHACRLARQHFGL
jgi:hypothetical protein